KPAQRPSARSSTRPPSPTSATPQSRAASAAAPDPSPDEHRTPPPPSPALNPRHGPLGAGDQPWQLLALRRVPGTCAPRAEAPRERPEWADERAGPCQDFL